MIEVNSTSGISLPVNGKVTQDVAELVNIHRRNLEAKGIDFPNQWDRPFFSIYMETVYWLMMCSP